MIIYQNIDFLFLKITLRAIAFIIKIGLHTDMAATNLCEIGRILLQLINDDLQKTSEKYNNDFERFFL